MNIIIKNANMQPMQGKVLLIGLYAVSTILIIFFGFTMFTQNSDLPKIAEMNEINIDPIAKFDVAATLIDNNKWLFNNNIIQYSAYLVVNNGAVFNIESMIFINFDASIKQLRCLVYDFSQRVFSFNVTFMYKTIQSDVRKIVCVIEEFIMNEDDIVGVAIIIETDFTINKNEVKNEKYPFGLINFQRPDHLKIHEPRIPDVGVCLQYVSHIYPGIIDWLNLHKIYKVAELVMYDSSTDGSLRRLVNDRFNFVNIYDNYISGPSCDYPAIQSYKTEFPEPMDIYLKKCARSSHAFFGDNEKRNQMSSNDCYIKFSYKYEFVTLYDLDELTIPRKYNQIQLAESKHICGDSKLLCGLDPFMKMYDYFRNLIEESFTHPISSLRSIQFPHAAYFIPNEVQTRLMNNLKAISDKIESNNLTDKFPLKVPILTYHGGEMFVIEEADKDYVVQLSKTYESFMCYYDAHLKNIQGIGMNLVRFLYYTPPSFKRFHKSIFYTKNVYAIFTHDPIFFENSSIVLTAPWTGGHVNAHFRLDLSVFFYQPSDTNIRKLAIDYEFAAFLLKNFTTFC